MAQDDSSKVQLQIRLDDDVALGNYVNMARIFHNQTEFVVDALFLPPQSAQAQVMSRLILNPQHAKSLFHALAHNIRMYEQQFGPIQPPKTPTLPKTDAATSSKASDSGNEDLN